MNARVPADNEYVGKARALVPELAKTARETAAARRMLAANVELIRDAGLFRILQPKRVGGYEASLHAHIDVVETLARGCGSTAWCVGVAHAHAWLMGSFNKEAQADVYAKNPDARLSAVLAPRGQAGATKNGYTLNGFWPFCSGVHHSQWLILGAVTHGADGQPDGPGLLLLPTTDVAIQDDWYVGGLAGTGSNSVVAKEVFVPAHRVIPLGGLIEATLPAIGEHASTLYYSAAVPVLALFLCAPAIGIAARALEAFVSKLPGRKISYTFDEKQIEMPVTHLEVAEAATKIDAARVILHAMVDEVESYAGKHEVMPIERRAKARMDCAFAVRLCYEAVEIIFLASGGSGLAEGSPIYFAERDLHAINMHGLLTLKTNLEMYGRVLVGLPPNSPTI